MIKLFYTLYPLYSPHTYPTGAVGGWECVDDGRASIIIVAYFLLLQFNLAYLGDRIPYATVRHCLSGYLSCLHAFSLKLACVPDLGPTSDLEFLMVSTCCAVKLT